MLSRHDISDDHYHQIANLLPGQAGQHGGVSGDNQLFLNAILYITETGIAWTDPSSCYGNWNSVWHRDNRWCKTGVWAKIATALRDHDTARVSIDSTTIRANASTSVAQKKPTDGAVRRPRRWAAAGADSARKSTPS